jgi:hypothetical protein
MGKTGTTSDFRDALFDGARLSGEVCRNYENRGQAPGSVTPGPDTPRHCGQGLAENGPAPRGRRLAWFLQHRSPVVHRLASDLNLVRVPR